MTRTTYNPLDPPALPKIIAPKPAPKSLRPSWKEFNRLSKTIFNGDPDKLRQSLLEMADSFQHIGLAQRLGRHLERFVFPSGGNADDGGEPLDDASRWLLIAAQDSGRDDITQTNAYLATAFLAGVRYTELMTAAQPKEPTKKTAKVRRGKR